MTQAGTRSERGERSGIFTQLRKETLLFSLPYVLIYLVPLGFIVSKPLTLRGSLAALLILCAAAIYVVSWFVSPIAPSRTSLRTIVLVGTLLALTIAASFAYPDDSANRWWMLQTFSFVASAWVLQAGRLVVLPGLGILFLLLAGASLLMGIPFGLAIAGIGITLWVGVLCGISRLSIERQRQTDLATEQRHKDRLENDRQLVSAELHDVLGQELAGIAIKTQLLQRLLQTNQQELADRQAREIGEMARRALDDVRVVVARTRDWSVGEELDSAQDLLRAAGVSCTVAASQSALTGTQGAVYARVIREGVTNILRHSDATWCTIEMSDDHLEIRNDGCVRQNGSPSGLAALAKQTTPVGALNWKKEGTVWTLTLTKSV